MNVKHLSCAHRPTIIGHVLANYKYWTSRLFISYFKLHGNTCIQTHSHFTEPLTNVRGKHITSAQQCKKSMHIFQESLALELATVSRKDIIKTPNASPICEKPLT